MSAPTMRELCAKATPGPWKVYEQTHNAKAGDKIVKITELMIGTADYHPQLKAPLPVVGGSVSLDESGQPLHTVFIREKDAQLIARCSPEIMLEVVETLEAASYWWPHNRPHGSGQASGTLLCGHIGPTGAPCCQRCARKKIATAAAKLNGATQP